MPNPDRIAAEAQAAAWNEQHPIGTTVLFSTMRTRTVARAGIAGGTTAVVWVAGVSTPVPLDHVKPVED